MGVNPRGVIQDVQTSPLPTIQITIAQQRMAQAAWQPIQPARQDLRMMRNKLHDLEERFDSLVSEQS